MNPYNEREVLLLLQDESTQRKGFVLEKATQLYQSTNMDLERNFEKLITGVNENFTRKNISLLEFIDYYDSYKETCIQLYEIKKNVFLAMENLNTVVGQNVLNY